MLIPPVQTAAAPCLVSIDQQELLTGCGSCGAAAVSAAVERGVGDKHPVRFQHTNIAVALAGGRCWVS
jgi:proline racemase